jgi:hypothetical protein
MGTTKISFQSTSKSFGLLYLETLGKNIMVIPDVLMVARKETFTLTSIKSTYLYEYNVFFWLSWKTWHFQEPCMNYIQEYFSQPLVTPPRLITRDGLLFRKGRTHIDRFVNTNLLFYYFYNLLYFFTLFSRFEISSSLRLVLSRALALYFC